MHVPSHLIFVDLEHPILNSHVSFSLNTCHYLIMAILTDDVMSYDFYFISMITNEVDPIFNVSVYLVHFFRYY